MDESPAKRQKTLASSPPSSTSSSKGKEKMEEIEEETCGICLSESVRSIRGRIDSCDHYFCFVCIMEWAKIESRCPLCKRRFGSILRPAVLGVFPSERVVDVAVRDQVYHPLGNESSSLSDPYANINCTVCHCSNQEELLLLCDLCDSAYHTFCTGLGMTVPDGDWYCPDCTISRDQHEKSQLNEDSNSCNQQENAKNVKRVEITDMETTVSISDIVASEPARDQSVKIEVGARTLVNCRYLHGRIRALRENWSALRAGSLGFANPSSSIRNESGKINGITGNNATIGEPSNSIEEENKSSDIQKAWKMMEIAKSAGQMKKVPKIPTLLSSNPSVKSSALRPVTYPKSEPRNYDNLNKMDVNRKLSHENPVSNSHIIKPSSVGIQSRECTSSSKETQKISPGKIENYERIELSNTTAKGKAQNLQERYSYENESAKSEIQSLVKLNLKVLNRDKKLGKDRFKEIARVSTHTILSACGLEHKKSAVHQIPSLMCKHGEEIRRKNKSNLTPHSCRECFFNFVQVVVTSVLSEKHED